MASDRYVEYDLKTKTVIQHIESYGVFSGASWFDDKTLQSVVADFTSLVATLIEKWCNKPVKIGGEYVEADGTRKYGDRLVVFSELKFSWDSESRGEGMDLFLNGIRPMTEDEVLGIEIQDKHVWDMQKSYREKQFQALRAEFAPDSQ